MPHTRLKYILLSTLLLVNTHNAFSEENVSDISYIPPPVLASENYPCSDCHDDMEANPQRRELSENHSDIIIEGHGEDERWCLDCHDSENRDTLILLTGEKVDFLNSQRLCRQCHGTIYNAWEKGIHGKRIGNWDGKKQVYLCASCHNPHSPKFKKLTPEPSPKTPGETLMGGGHETDH